jgi:hypothetical protein
MINKISEQFVNLCMKHCIKKKNKEIIKNKILDPLIIHVIYQLKPILICTMIYLISTFVMIIALIVILLSGPVDMRPNL